MMSQVKKGLWSLVSSLVMVLMLPVTVTRKPLTGFDSLDVNFGRFYKAATQTSKHLLKEVFIMMLHRSHVCFVEEWPSTVADYCCTVLSWSKGKYRENFTPQERELLEKPVISAEFDVSLITKMIHKLFARMDLSEPLTRAVRDVKNIRNRVCHEYQVLDNAQLRDHFDDLKTVFNNLLKELEEFFSVNIEELQQAYLQEVDDILSSPSTPEAQEYFDQAEFFQADLVGRFITRGRQELMNFYAKLKSLNPFTWLNDEQFSEMLVDKIFTPLHISDKSRSIDMASILCTEIFNEEIQEPTGILPSVLIMSGIAGCGKTSLCRYFLHDWRTKLGAITGLRSVDILIHIEMRNVTCNSLISHLQRILLQDTLNCFGEQDIINILQQINVLYIIDGLDEATADGIQLMNSVLSTLGSSRVILTTRPEFTGNIIQSAKRHHLTTVTLDIEGFSGQGINDFTSHVFAAIEPNEEKRSQQEKGFVQFLKTAGRGLGDQLKLPLTVALLICLWRVDYTRLSRVSCVTRLYSEIFRMCTMKLITRLQANTALHHLELEAFVKKWLLDLAQVAYHMLDKNEYVISGESRDKLVSMCNDRQINSIQVLSAYLSCEVEDKMTNIQYHFSFIHKSQMEYLAAKYLVQEMTGTPHPNTHVITKLQQRFVSFNINKKAQSLLSIPIKQLTAYKWTNTLKFIVGHLCINKVEDSVLREVVLQLMELPLSRNAASLWQVVQESECHPIVCELVGNIKRYMWHPDSDELCDPLEPNFQLLKHTSFTPAAVLFRVVGSTDAISVVGENGRVERRACGNLLPLLVCLAQRTTYTLLRMDQQYYDWGNPETSDTLLTTLLPKGNLTAFMGHVGVSGAAALASAKKLADVLVRVSHPDTLHVLKQSLSKVKGSIKQLSLRLDIPSTVPVSSLPSLVNLPVMRIRMKGVDDTCATWAAEVLAQLSCSYKVVDLVASGLTPSGADIFLKVLVDRHIGITESLTIRSCHKLEETHYQQMCSMLKCSFEWWD